MDNNWSFLIICPIFFPSFLKTWQKKAGLNLFILDRPAVELVWWSVSHMLLAFVYLWNDALLAGRSELLSRNEVNRAPRLLHRGHPALSALHWVREQTRSTQWGALSLHLFSLPPQVAILRVQMTRYTWNHNNFSIIGIFWIQLRIKYIYFKNALFWPWWSINFLSVVSTKCLAHNIIWLLTEHVTSDQHCIIWICNVTSNKSY